jgi:Family of unknown function (DUF5681)
MTPPAPPKPPRSAVGYGRPPAHTRFRPGVSGNPRGRPPGISPARARKLALKEAYRLITVRDGDKTVRVPVLQAVLRSQLALAAKGHGPAQRAVVATIRAFEAEAAAEATAQAQATANRAPFSYTEATRRILLLLRLGYEEQGRKMPEDGDMADIMRDLVYNDPRSAKSDEPKANQPQQQNAPVDARQRARIAGPGEWS